jgi:three-Cys-motif partner protein
LNIEENRNTFANLTSNTAPYSSFVQNFQGRLARQVDPILSIIGNNPALYFLDPFGLRGIEWEILLRLLSRSRTARTELLINLHVPDINRHAGWLGSDNERPREGFLKLLDRTMGTPDWREIWAEQLDTAERYHRIVRFYLSRIAGLDQGFAVVSYPVRTLERKRLKYYLVFATRNWMAVRIMSSILYNVDKRYAQAHATLITQRTGQLPFTVDENMRSPQEIEDNNVKQLEKDIMELAKTRGHVTYDLLQNLLMPNWFGRVGQAAFRKACVNLVNSRQMSGPLANYKDGTILQFNVSGT